MIYIEFFPYPVLFGLVILSLAGYFSRKRVHISIPGMAVFGIYLLFLIGLVFFPLRIPANWPDNLTWNETINYLTQRINFIPFYYGSRTIYTSIGMVERTVPYREILGNIVVTIPFGMGVKAIYRPRWKSALWLALIGGFSLETIQLLLRLALGVSTHVVDINDVIFNTLGIFIGYGLYEVAAWGADRVKSTTIKRSEMN